jgi:hypothetical protein
VSVAVTARRVLFALATSAEWERAVRAFPGGEQGAYRLARRYVGGTRLDEALACVHRLAAGGLASSIDFFGEGVSDPIHADRVADDYVASRKRWIGRLRARSCRSIFPTSASISRARP